MSKTLITNEKNLEIAAKLLKNGDLVAIPTETVYGLAVDATNGRAVASLFTVKGRPNFNPLICHVSNIEMAQKYVIFDEISLFLAKTFWPGPLTLILPIIENCAIHPLTRANLPTIGIRIPQGPAQKLIEKCGFPLAAPSANTSGRLSPTSAELVENDIGKKINLILDAGSCKIGLESTIIKVEKGKIFLLRPGGILAESIEHATLKPVLRRDQRASIEAPGMLPSHYAPHAMVRINATDIKPNEALLSFGNSKIPPPPICLNLSKNGDLVEAAVNLFSYLNQLDTESISCIAVEKIPNTGLGEAINDRLIRAASERKT
jgi:L-threonylcarbamoyladenylate synthase